MFIVRPFYARRILAQIIIKETNTILRRADIIKYLNMYYHTKATVIINIELQHFLIHSLNFIIYIIFLQLTSKSV